jgi:hypothetical protein
MKNYRNTLAVLLMVFVLATSAFGGDGIMHTGITPPPPPPPPPVQAEGLMWTEINAPTSEDDTLTEIALNLLQTLIPLL